MTTLTPGTSVPQIPTIGRQEADGSPHTVCPRCGSTRVYGNGPDATELACPDCGMQYDPRDYEDALIDPHPFPPTKFDDLNVGETFHVGSTLYKKTNDVQLPDFGWVNAFRVSDDRPLMFYDDAIVERGAR